ncbi:MAG: hypothetical protein K2Y08_07155 [Alphaproteobacteria bacterium]|nr:hypothetical protein [Alphaproteobacteria bacterium]
MRLIFEFFQTAIWFLTPHYVKTYYKAVGECLCDLSRHQLVFGDSAGLLNISYKSRLLNLLQRNGYVQHLLTGHHIL